METFYAPAERKSEDGVERDIRTVNASPLLEGVLQQARGLLAILNEERQILAINKTFLEYLGVEDAKGILGLRPGETLGCVHASEMEGGCGTSRYCASCGAAIAIVSSLGMNEPVERICCLEAKRGEDVLELTLSVRSQPLEMEGRRYLLLFLQDVTHEQLWARLERTFFHDVSGMVNGLLLAAEELQEGKVDPETARAIHRACQRLSLELRLQRHLFQSGLVEYRPTAQSVKVSQILNEFKSVLIGHPSVRGKVLDIDEGRGDLLLETDVNLVLRVLYNMAVNALEATPEGGTVRFWFEPQGEAISFFVWNEGTIPEEIALRVFQRNFTTKQGMGHGIGTYSMKLLGEKSLGGKIDFSSKEGQGTTFRFRLPRAMPRSDQ